MHIAVEPRFARQVKVQLETQNVDFHLFKKDSKVHFAWSGNANVDVPFDLHPELIDSANSNETKRQQGGVKYAFYPPMVLLPTGSSISLQEGRQLLEQLHATHLAVNAEIDVDRVRRPQIKPLIGDFGQFLDTDEPSQADFDAAFWCTCKQNGLWQTWAPLYTMFSRGNVTEKKRVLDTFASQNTIKDTVVVDLYAGIGYFTLAYAANNPRRVFCWEINPWSVQGLIRGCKANKFPVRLVLPSEEYVEQEDDFMVVFCEDNQNAIRRLANVPSANVPSANVPSATAISHINMGLLPDCRAAFNVAQHLKGEKTVVHVHENVKADAIADWQEQVSAQFGRCLHVESIKMYAPGVVHVCGDFT